VSENLLIVQSERSLPGLLLQRRLAPVNHSQTIENSIKFNFHSLRFILDCESIFHYVAQAWASINSRDVARMKKVKFIIEV
jgi:hypothetical protein